MSYTISPFLVKIEDLKKAVGSKDRSLMIAVLQNRAKEYQETFDESELDAEQNSETDEEEDEESWNTVEAVKAWINGDLNSEKIQGFQYGYALEAICMSFGERVFIEPLESVRSSSYFEEQWSWFMDSKSPIPYPEEGDDFPYIGHLNLADIPAELQRTQKLDFEDCDEDEDEQEWFEEIREELVPLYEKALEQKKDIVTFYY